MKLDINDAFSVLLGLGILLVAFGIGAAYLPAGIVALGAGLVGVGVWGLR